MILDFQYRASTRPRTKTQTFKIRLESEFQVGTLLRQNLKKCLPAVSQIQLFRGSPQIRPLTGRRRGPCWLEAFAASARLCPPAAS